MLRVGRQKEVIMSNVVKSGQTLASNLKVATKYPEVACLKVNSKHTQGVVFTVNLKDGAEIPVFRIPATSLQDVVQGLKTYMTSPQYQEALDASEGDSKTIQEKDQEIATLKAEMEEMRAQMKAFMSQQKANIVEEVVVETPPANIDDLFESIVEQPRKGGRKKKK